MKPSRSLLGWVAALVGLGAGFAGFAAQPDASRNDPGKDAAALLSAAQDAVARLQTLAYNATVAAQGPLAGASGTYAAIVVSRRIDAGGWAVRTTGDLERRASDAKGAEGKPPVARHFEVAYDGVTAHALREANKQVAEITTTDLADLRLFFMSQDAGKCVAWELIDTPAYAEATRDGTLALDGTATADGIACNILKVTGKADVGGASVTRYFLGAVDNLPRRIERSRLPAKPPASGAQDPTWQVLTLKDLKPDAPVGPSEFVVAVPDGYTVVPAAGRRAPAAERPVRPPAPPRESGLLAVGAGAPEWSLKGGDGKAHTLSEYRGKVVVMDFWGTWCPWCIKAMPAIQKVHEKFKGHPVVVLGMNYESQPTADPAAYMEKNKFTYGLILRAGEIATAYKVSGWPTIYVIGADGKVLFAKGGFSPTLEEELTTVIEQGLKDAGL